MLYNLHFFSSKCRLFRNTTLFAFCITHILNTGVPKFEKKSVAKRLKHPANLYDLCYVQCTSARHTVKYDLDPQTWYHWHTPRDSSWISAVRDGHWREMTLIEQTMGIHSVQNSEGGDWSWNLKYEGLLDYLTPYFQIRGSYRKSWETFLCMRTGNSRRRRVRW